jgi:hypothetical protein
MRRRVGFSFVQNSDFHEWFFVAYRLRSQARPTSNSVKPAKQIGGTIPPNVLAREDKLIK